MRLIDRYITRSILLNLAGTLLIFTLLFILVDSASNLEDYISHQVPLSVVVQYYVWFLPVILQQSLPIACLIACLLTYSTLNAHNELIALRSGGLGFWKLARPALTVGLLTAALMFYLNEHHIPQAEIRAKTLKESNFTTDSSREKKPDVIQNLTFYGMQNRLYFIDTFDPASSTLTGITMISFDQDQNILEKVVALEGTWTGLLWKFRQCNITPFQQKGSGPSRIMIYDEKLMDIKETPEDFIKQRQNVTLMNIRELRAYIERFANSGALRAVNNLRVDLHAKFALPLTAPVILLLGLPLVMTGGGKRQSRTITALGVSILIGFLYYVANAVGLAMGKGGILPPVAAAWLAPAFFSLTAVYIIRNNF